MMRRLWPWIGWSAVGALALWVSWLIATPEIGPATRRPVIVVNPLDEPAKVRLGDREVTVGPVSRTSTSVATGQVAVEVRGGDGRLLDRHTLFLPDGGAGQAVYAVLGAAPLGRAPVIYTASSDRRPAQPPPSAFQVLVGERLQLVVADFLFTTPPEHLQLPGSGQVIKSHVDLAPGGWRAALSRAPEAAGGLPAAYALARRLLRAAPPAERWRPLAMAMQCAAVLDGPEAALALATEGLEAAPGSELTHRLWSQAMRVAGHAPELREHYRRLAAEQPDSALAAAMRVRTAGRDEAEAVARAALARFPDDPGVLRAAGYALALLGKPAEAAAALQRIRLGSAEESGYVEPLVRALALAGKPQAAAAAALGAARVKDADASDLALLVRAARLRGARLQPAPEEVLRGWAAGNEDSVVWVRALVGELDPAEVARLVLPPSDREMVSILAWASRDPGKALDGCSRRARSQLLELPDAVATPLALEAYRTGARAVFQHLLHRLPASEGEIAAWIERGVEPAEAWRFDESDRAAFALVRARRLRAAGQPVPPALAEAARADPLGGFVSLAADRWAEPAAGSNALHLLPGP